MIFALTDLKKDCSILFEEGYFGKGFGEFLEDALKELMVRLRPQMLPLVESFGISDSTLNSCIGNKYGDIYQ